MVATSLTLSEHSQPPLTSRPVSLVTVTNEILASKTTLKIDYFRFNLTSGLLTWSACRSLGPWSRFLRLFLVQVAFCVNLREFFNFWFCHFFGLAYILLTNGVVIQITGWVRLTVVYINDEIVILYLWLWCRNHFWKSTRVPLYIYKTKTLGLSGIGKA